MTYTAPYVDETGLHYSSFQDIKEFYQDGARRIFGNDIYIDDDSMDGQLISIFAKGTYDTCKMLEYAYNNTTPQTSYGTVLSRLVLLSGIERKKAGYSTVYCKLTGTPFTIIRNGVVQDIANNRWNLPAVVNLGENGTVYVTATAEQKGNITAPTNTVTTIATPTYGWKTVTNEYPAEAGQPVETDEELRFRQKRSTALPSQGLLQGTESALLNIEGVTNVRVAENYENSAVTVDGVSLPPHSITCIVEGGSEADIASTIFYKKNQGCNTNGSIEVTQYDTYNNATTIRFSRPTEVDIIAQIRIMPIKNYSSDITDEIKNNVYNYINSLGISNDVTLSALYSVVNNSIPDLTDPLYSIYRLKIAVSGDSYDVDDIVISLNEKAHIELADIDIEVIE